MEYCAYEVAPGQACGVKHELKSCSEHTKLFFCSVVHMGLHHNDLPNHPVTVHLFDPPTVFEAPKVSKLISKHYVVV
jgi:hypothetical protein